LKSVSVVIDARRSAVRPGLLQICLLNFFYPAYSAGPIDRAKTFADKELASTASFDNLWQGLQRVLLGIFKVNFVVGKLIVAVQTSRFDHALDRPGDFSTQELWLAVMLAFVSLYVSFSGYTDIAVGTARLFGIRLRENFDNPLFANSIQNFWQRWHRSLAGFVSDYVFLPLVRATGNPYLGIFVAFFLAGLWHELTINYVIWGSLHGAALALNMRYSRTVKKYPTAQRLNQNVLVDVVCRVLTLGFVAWLSAFANRDSLDLAWGLTRALLGLQ
jgi:alginate O-acetyltransferase complex protein AlgI